MEKTELLGLLAVLFLVGILFTPLDSNIWQWFLTFGVAFGALYYVKK